ncbi:MAG: hypothetical protein GC200_00860 [Tepidisphaera sp.]|nr:hypothetical protein [Tepidisphaera sp.]
MSRWDTSAFSRLRPVRRTSTVWRPGDKYALVRAFKRNSVLDYVVGRFDVALADGSGIGVSGRDPAATPDD